MDATIFVWETRDWAIKAGYVYSPNKASRIEDKLRELVKAGEVLWFRRFDLSGYTLKFWNLQNLSEDEVS